MQIQFKTAALSALAAAVLAACGGGGSAPTTTTTFAGTVMDGYIEGATVCLDLNNNQTCDSGEPSAVSKADGTYSLDVSALTTAQISAAHLLTVVPLSAKDADDGGQTLAQAGKPAFNLMAPASAFVSGNTLNSAVISPLTTLLSHDMIAGNNKPLATAQTDVATRMGLAAGTNLMQNFVAANNTALMTQARVIAAAIGEVKKQALAVQGTNDRDALMAALTYLQQNVVALQLAVTTGAGAAAPTPAQIVLQVKAATAQAAAGAAANALAPATVTLLATAQQITNSTAMDFMPIMAEGFYSGAATPYYSKVQGSGGTWTSQGYSLTAGGAWLPMSAQNPATGVQNYVMTTSGWTLFTGSGASGTVASDGQGGGTATNNRGAFRHSTRVQDVGGKTAASIASPLMGLAGAPNSALGGAAGLTFPTGAKVYWMQFAQFGDRYSLTVQPAANGAPGNEVTTQVCAAGAVTCTTRSLTSLTDLMSSYATATATANATVTPTATATGYPTIKGIFSGGSGSGYSFDAGSTATGGMITFWTQPYCTANVSCTATTNGHYPYTIKTINGEQILTITLASMVPNLNTNYADSLPLFTIKGGLVYQGYFTPPSSALGIALPYFNKIAIDALLAAASQPATVN